DLDEAVVGDLVEESAAAGREIGEARTYVQALLPGLRLCQTDRAHLRVGERHSRDRAVVGGRPVLAEDAAYGDRGLVHRHVGERTFAGDVADRPQSVGDAQVVVDVECPYGRVELDRREPEVVQVGTTPGRHEQTLGSQRTVADRDGERRTVVSDARCRR